MYRKAEAVIKVHKKLFFLLLGCLMILALLSACGSGQQAAGQIHHRTEEERQVDKKKEQVGAQALLRNGQGVGPVHPRGQGDEEKADEGLDQEKGQQREKAPPLKTP